MDSRELMADAKFYEGYSRYLEDSQRYEGWEESVSRVMNMHREFYKDKMTPELSSLIDYTEQAYKDKRMLGAQRALQFGGEQLLKHQIRMYNCVSSHCDRPVFFQECFYMLLCGAGAGFSVQQHHIDKLPDIGKRTKTSKAFVVEDSIEGWSDAFGVLLSSYFCNAKGGEGIKDAAIPFPEYSGRKVYFDLNKIRAKGSFISGGFKAPGSAPLRMALDNMERMLESAVSKGQTRLRPIQAYDLVMFGADAVISGGIRRSATICIFSPEDEEMMNAKVGNWFFDNPQRGRSNNSAMIIRDEIDKGTFQKLMKSVESFGEPGWIFSDNKEFTYNPLKLAA